MIIGNWVDEEGNIAAILNPDEVNLKITSNNYTLGTNWGTYWYYDETYTLLFAENLDGMEKVYIKFDPEIKSEYDYIILYRKERTQVPGRIGRAK